MVPLIQMTDRPEVETAFGADLDLVLHGDPASWPRTVLDKIAAVATHDYTPRLYHLGNIDFQVTRGLLGVSM
jgi:hypothetical protein